LADRYKNREDQLGLLRLPRWYYFFVTFTAGAGFMVLGFLVLLKILPI
jgi:hypothetical protein